MQQSSVQSKDIFKGSSQSVAEGFMSGQGQGELISFGRQSRSLNKTQERVA